MAYLRAKRYEQRTNASGFAVRFDRNTHLHKTLNPFALKKTIEFKLSLIFKNVRVTSNLRQRI